MTRTGLVSNPSTVSETAVAIHFGVSADIVDEVIRIGMESGFANSIAAWRPPVITHGDDWFNWNEEIVSGAVHMNLGVEPEHLEMGIIWVRAKFDGMLVQQNGSDVAVSNARHWTEGLTTVY